MGTHCSKQQKQYGKYLYNFQPYYMGHMILSVIIYGPYDIVGHIIWAIWVRFILIWLLGSEMRKGLLAPQNTFLDTIAERFDGSRKFLDLGSGLNLGWKTQLGVGVRFVIFF